MLVAVFDIPLSATADEAALVLTEHCEDGFYINAIIEWPGTGARVFMRRYAKPAAAKPAPSPVSVPNKEARAMQFIRDNREMAASGLEGALKALGFPRSRAWISKKRVEIIRADRRVPGDNGTED